MKSEVIRSISHSIIFSRHGRTEYNDNNLLQGQTDTPLSENGVEDSLAIAKSLEGQPILNVITSTLNRSIKTGELIIQALNLNSTVQPLPHLVEYGLGDWEGKNSTLLQKTQPHEEWVVSPFSTQARLNVPPNGEILHAFIGRVALALESIYASKPTDEATKNLVICHAMVIRAIRFLFILNNQDMPLTEESMLEMEKHLFWQSQNEFLRIPHAAFIIDYQSARIIPITNRS